MEIASSLIPSGGIFQTIKRMIHPKIKGKSCPLVIAVTTMSRVACAQVIGGFGLIRVDFAIAGFGGPIIKVRQTKSNLIITPRPALRGRSQPRGMAAGNQARAGVPVPPRRPERQGSATGQPVSDGEEASRQLRAGAAAGSPGGNQVTPTTSALGRGAANYRISAAGKRSARGPGNAPGRAGERASGGPQPHGAAPGATGGPPGRLHPTR